MRIVLLGGGLGHIQYIRDRAKNLSAETEVILIAPQPQVFYQPAFEDVLVGRQPIQDAIIDLRKISTLAGVTFIQSEIDEVDTVKKLIKLTQRASIQFDYLSIEGVEVPKLLAAANYHQAFYANNTLEFFRKIEELEVELEETRPNGFDVAVIGAGRLGITLSRYLPERFRKYSPKLGWEVFEKSDTILPNYQTQIRRRLEQDLKAKDVLFHTNFLVGNVNGGLIRDVSNPKRHHQADLVFICASQECPTWIKQSGLPVTTDGFLDAHPNLMLKGYPFIVASGEVIGKHPTAQDIKEHTEAIVKMVDGQAIATKKAFNKIKKRDTYLFGSTLLQMRFGFLKESEKAFQEQQLLMKASLEHLRAVKEQKRAQLSPLVEENTYVEKLKKRLSLDIPVEGLKELFTESLSVTHQIDGWFEREYKDVFNDHYLSSYHTGLDLLDQGYIRGGLPEYIRLYISAPVNIKDVEILSQIIIGAFQACNTSVDLKVHICSQAMNTVQFSMGAKIGEQKRKIPEPMAYIALTRPLGLYGVLSQQGKSIWEGKWLSQMWEPLSRTHQSFAHLSPHLQNSFSVFQLDESGLMNDLVKHLGTEGQRICVNLSQLPRWEGVDQILKQNPMDQLIERNWQKGFRYWAGQDQRIPDSQYLLWEPHLARPATCLLVDPASAHELNQELMKDHLQKLHFIGYVEQTAPGQQTVYKLSDWTFDSKHDEMEPVDIGSAPL